MAVRKGSMWLLPYDGMVRIRFQGSGQTPPLSLTAPPAMKDTYCILQDL
ncbi:hypothetical protein JCM31598_33610 [Desulfonatronum parangueonense]